MFEYNTTIKLFHTDAAGILFFGAIYTLAHETVEAWMEKSGIPIKDILYKRDYLIPVVHSESDLRHPLRVGDKICIRASIEHVGNSSFSTAYEFSNDAGELLAKVKIVNVSILKATGVKIPLPTELLEKLLKHS